MEDQCTTSGLASPGCEVLDEALPAFGEVFDQLPLSGLPLSEVKLQYPNDYEVLLEKLYDLDDGIVGKFMAQDWTDAGVIFEHIYPIGEFTDIARLVEKLDSIGNGLRHRALFGYSFDPKEVHIFHDCAYANKSCRCTFKAQLPGIKAKIGINRKRCSEVQWMSFILYYLFRKRGPQKVWLGGICQGPVNSCKHKLYKL
jgi:hypothetical protein